MPIEVTCSECTRRLRVPDKVAGKRIKCPKCGSVVRVPDAANTPATQEPSPPSPKQPAQPKAETATTKTWWLKTEDGEQYGPVPKPELDDWFEEGRITADCQLLLDGADQWQWASEIYPELDSTPAPAPGPASVPTPSPVIPDSGKTPVGPVVVPDATPAASAAPAAFDFAAADTSATARARGRKRVRKVAKRPTATPQPSAAQPTAPQPSTPDMPVAEPDEMSSKSKVVAGLLGIFLGCYGVHRFYLGYTSLGLIMLCTCGGCGIWSLIDAIMVFTGNVPDAEGRPLQ